MAYSNVINNFIKLIDSIINEKQRFKTSFIVTFQFTYLHLSIEILITLQQQYTLQS